MDIDGVKTKIYFIYFDRAVWLAGSQFPNQGLNLGHGSERPES